MQADSRGGAFSGWEVRTSCQRLIPIYMEMLLMVEWLHKHSLSQCGDSGRQQIKCCYSCGCFLSEERRSHTHLAQSVLNYLPLYCYADAFGGTRLREQQVLRPSRSVTFCHVLLVKLHLKRLVAGFLMSTLCLPQTSSCWPPAGRSSTAG